MLKGVMLSFCVTWIASAQMPFANLYWEVNDGSGWTRNQLTTTQQNVQVRLAAEWGGETAISFGGTQFDAVIGNANENDNVSSILRSALFSFIPQTPTAFRFDNMIKLDSDNDTGAPGAGAFWLDCSQTNIFGDPVDMSNPVVIFRFDLHFADVAGTRNIDSVSRLRPGPPAYNARLLTMTGDIRVLAEVYDIDVTYVPTPASVVLLGLSAAMSRCRR